MRILEWKIFGGNRSESDAMYVWAKDADDALEIACRTDKDVCAFQWTGRERNGGDPMKRLWYAVMEKSTDAWDYGSHDFYEAVDMLKKQGYGEIAVIDEDDAFCINEYSYDDVVEE